MGITTNAHIVDSRESEARPVSTDPLEIVLITGMSGAGRGTAARLLEEFLSLIHISEPTRPY